MYAIGEPTHERIRYELLYEILETHSNEWAKNPVKPDYRTRNPLRAKIIPPRQQSPVSSTKRTLAISRRNNPFLSSNLDHNPLTEGSELPLPSSMDPPLSISNNGLPSMTNESLSLPSLNHMSPSATNDHLSLPTLSDGLSPTTNDASLFSSDVLLPLSNDGTPLSSPSHGSNSMRNDDLSLSSSSYGPLPLWNDGMPSLSMNASFDSPPRSPAQHNVLSPIPQTLIPRPRLLYELTYSSSDITTQTMPEFTARLLHGRQRGRSTDWWSNWTIHPAPSTGEFADGYTSFTVAFQGSRIVNMRMIQYPPERNGKYHCIHGCMVSGLHQWISNGEYALCFTGISNK